MELLFTSAWRVEELKDYFTLYFNSLKRCNYKGKIFIFALKEDFIVLDELCQGLNYKLENFSEYVEKYNIDYIPDQGKRNFVYYHYIKEKDIQNTSMVINDARDTIFQSIPDLSELDEEKFYFGEEMEGNTLQHEWIVPQFLMYEPIKEDYKFLRECTKQMLCSGTGVGSLNAFCKMVEGMLKEIKIRKDNNLLKISTGIPARDQQLLNVVTYLRKNKNIGILKYNSKILANCPPDSLFKEGIFYNDKQEEISIIHQYDRLNKKVVEKVYDKFRQK